MTIDEKYIEKLSTHLPNFRKVKDGVYRFDCVFCVNSKTNNKKWSRRTDVSLGYLYLKGYTYNYCCHIWGTSNNWILINFIVKPFFNQFMSVFAMKF